MSAPTIPTTPTPTPKKQRRWPYIAAILVALFVGIGIGGQTAAPAAPSAAPVTVTVPAPAEGAFTADGVAHPEVANPYLPNAGGSLPAVPAPTYPPAPVYVPTGPLTTFSEGIYEVGTGDGQVAPGKYKSTNVNGDGSVFVKKSGDSYGDYAIGKGQLIVTVTKSDVEVEVRNATFVKM